MYNLEWTTYQENSEHSKAIGLSEDFTGRCIRGTGWKHTEETKLKQSKSATGRKRCKKSVAKGKKTHNEKGPVYTLMNYQTGDTKSAKMHYLKKNSKEWFGMSDKFASKVARGTQRSCKNWILIGVK